MPFIPKPAKGKPRSKLQRMHTQHQWVTNFRIQAVNYHDVSELKLTDSTNYLVAQYKALGKQLREAIDKDYKAHTDAIHRAAKQQKKTS